jgi:hypothetical protein
MAKMKNKTYHTEATTVPKSSRRQSWIEANYIPIANINKIVQFPGLVHAFDKKESRAS